MKITKTFLKFVLIIILSWSFHSFTFGQGESQQSNNDGLINLNIIPANADAMRNQAIIQQVGNNNTAEVSQQYIGNGMNSAILRQSGNNNMGIIQQIGAYLNTTLLQIGNNNNAELSSSGQNISQLVQQTGNRNSINTNFENNGNNLFNATLRQTGNNNNIDITFRGSELNLGEQFIINQTGNRQSFSGDISPISTPIQITQTPGFGGEGMQINVTTFPGFAPGGR